MRGLVAWSKEILACNGISAIEIDAPQIIYSRWIYKSWANSSAFKHGLCTNVTTTEIADSKTYNPVHVICKANCITTYGASGEGDIPLSYERDVHELRLRNFKRTTYHFCMDPKYSTRTLGVSPSSGGQPKKPPQRSCISQHWDRQANARICGIPFINSTRLST